MSDEFITMYMKNLSRYAHFILKNHKSASLDDLMKAQAINQMLQIYDETVREMDAK